jgi:plastocyanin
MPGHPPPTDMGSRFHLLAFGAASMLAACSGPPAAKKENATTPAYFKVDPSSAGAISGKVTFHGKVPPHKRVDMEEDPQCASLHKSPVFDDSIATSRDGSLANVFVYVKQGLEGKKFGPPGQPATIDQKGCWFVPRVLGIQTGQTLDVTNSDPVTHNIHPRAHINREWNQSQGPGAEPLARRFMTPEVMIRVKCNIHSWMHAWIGVVDNPYFAVTGADGSFELRNVPPGKYTVEACQEDLGTQQQEVTVPPQGNSEIAFTFQGESK